jgi:hypothetical protein
MKRYFPVLICIYFSFLLDCFAQPDSSALLLLKQFEDKQPQKSIYFEHVDTENYIDNIKRRIYNPENFNQGFGSQFCGPATLIANLLLTDQQGYVKLMIDLYEQGNAIYFNGKDSVRLTPDEQTRSYAGRIYDGAKYTEKEYRIKKSKNYFVEHSEFLSNNHADQTILLSLKYHYQGIGSKGSYRAGDITKKLGYASTLFKQFKQIAEEFFKVNMVAQGAAMHDMIPSNKKMLTMLIEACKAGKIVFIMVDGPYFRKETNFLTWGSHYIRIFDIEPHKTTIDFEMWDYGYRRWVKGYNRRRFSESISGYLIIEP